MAGNPLTNPTWATELADTVERVVGTVRDKTTKPAIRVARALVFGLLAAFLVAFAALVALIAAVRGLQALLDIFVSWPRAVYISYLLLGGILCLVGALLLGKRRAPRV